MTGPPPVTAIGGARPSSLPGLPPLTPRRTGFPAFSRLTPRYWDLDSACRPAAGIRRCRREPQATHVQARQDHAAWAAAPRVYVSAPHTQPPHPAPRHVTLQTP